MLISVSTLDEDDDEHPMLVMITAIMHGAWHASRASSIP